MLQHFQTERQINAIRCGNHDQAVVTDQDLVAGVQHRHLAAAAIDRDTSTGQRTNPELAGTQGDFSVLVGNPVAGQQQFLIGTTTYAELVNRQFLILVGPVLTTAGAEAAYQYIHGVTSRRTR